MARLTASLAAVLLVVMVVGSAAAAAPAPWTQGVATFTGSEDLKQVPNAACGYGSLPATAYPGLNLAGINFAANALAKQSMQGCGACLEIRCTDKEACNSAVNQTLTVMVFDDCSVNCEATQVNLQALPFARLAPLDVGRIAVEYRQVACAFPGNITVRTDAFRASGGGWARLLFRDVAGAPLAKAEVAPAGSDNWRALRNAFGAAWEGTRLPALPWDVRLTNTEGATLVLKSAVTSDKVGEVEAAGNF